MTTANLAFNHAGGDNQGLILDNVMLSVEEPEAVPESSSVLSLLVFGAFGVGSLLKSKL